MEIDVLINSCARPDILETSIDTFMKMVKSNNHTFRYVIVEDKVDNEKRQKLGKEFIMDNSFLFDKIVFLDEKAGPGYWWAKTIKLCRSCFHIHLEDDNEFIKKINIDPIISIMKSHNDIIEIIFSRGEIEKNLYPKETMVGNVALTEFESMSVASGLFNTVLVKQMANLIGWDKKMNEFSTLHPMANKLGFRRFFLGHNDKHYTHLGQKLNYRKGKWRL